MSTNSKTFLSGGEQVKLRPKSEQTPILGTLLYADLLGAALLPHKVHARADYFTGMEPQLDPEELAVTAQDRPVFYPWSAVASITVIAEGAR